MTKEELINQAEFYRNLYRLGKCSREEAKEMILPYLNFVNNTSKRICKKYNQKYKEVNFSGYVR